MLSMLFALIDDIFCVNLCFLLIYNTISMLISLIRVRGRVSGGVRVRSRVR